MSLTRPLRVIGALALTAVLGLQLTACDATYEPGKGYLVTGFWNLQDVNSDGVAVGTMSGMKAGVYDTKTQTITAVAPVAPYTQGSFEAINDAGLAAGTFYLSAVTQAFVHNTKTGGSKMIPLPSGFTMGSKSVAIDSVGRVVVEAYKPTGENTGLIRRFVYDHRDRTITAVDPAIASIFGAGAVADVVDISSSGTLLGNAPGPFALNWSSRSIATLPYPGGTTPRPVSLYELNKNGIAVGADYSCASDPCTERPYVYDRKAKAFVTLAAGTPKGPALGVSDGGLIWGPVGSSILGSSYTGWWYDLSTKRSGTLPKPTGVSNGCVLFAVNASRLGVGHCDSNKGFIYRVP